MPPGKRSVKTQPPRRTRGAKGRAAAGGPAATTDPDEPRPFPRPTKTRASEAGGARPRPTTRDARSRATTVAIVGSGRLGSALALALDARGYAIEALVARRRASARRAARRLAHSRPLALAADELGRLPRTDLLIIATPDDEIERTAARLASALDETTRASHAAIHTATRAAAVTPSRAKGARETPATPRGRASRVALHASGALSSEVLAPLRAHGFGVGSLHPLVSVADAETAARSFRGAFFCVEGDPKAARRARRLVRELGGRSFSVEARGKALYHAAAVMVAGHSVALFDLAARMLVACGLDRREARAVLLPLARSAVANLSAAPTNAAALTGPFARGDAATVRRHLAAFEEHAGEAALRNARQVYALLGAASLDLASAGGPDDTSAAEVARALSEAMSAKS